MDLRDLILEMDKCDCLPILVDEVARLLEKRGVRDDIDFVAADMNKEKVKGFVREWDYLAIYSERKTAARIYYANDLNDCWKRYICAKELVHLLDTKLSAVDTAEKLADLMIGMSIHLRPWLQEIQKNGDKEIAGGVPVPVSCLVDYAAEWWAIPVLVPPKARGALLERYNAKAMTDWDVAYTFRIPQKFVPFVVSPLYDQFVGALLTPPK